MILVSLPSHCTHRLQPLDISFLKSLNTYYDSGIQSWLRQHPGRVVTEFQIAELFKAAYGRAATVQNGTSGFRKAGIYPFNKDLFTDEDFLCSQMTERPLPNISADQPSSDIQHELPSGTDSTVAVDQPSQSTSGTSGSADQPSNDVQSRCTLSKTFQDIVMETTVKSPLSHTVRKRRPVAHATVITSSPYKLTLQQQKGAATEVTEKRAKQVKKRKKVVKPSSSKKSRNESDNSVSVQQQDDETVCQYCEIKYCDSRVSWVRCSNCDVWSCRNCAHVGRGKRRYVCDTCK